MITLRNLSLQRGLKPIFEQVNLTIHASQKIGVVGANGAGKSTLFGLLRDELHADAGDVNIPPRLTIAHVAQETPALPTPAIEYVIDGDAELRTLQNALAIAETAHDGHRIAELHSQIEHADGYSAPARAAKLLAGLGFDSDQMQTPVSAFSGGWRMRLNLAQALMCRSELLLLDEPTNHLDLETVMWLESWLRSYPGTLLLISHDRDFLDATINTIAHVDNRQITLYTGNYESFEKQKAERLAQQQSAHAKQQREIAHLQSFVDRFKAKATKAKQAQSRVKALERMERIAAAHVDSPFEFSFREPESSPNPLLRIEQAKAGYGDKVVLQSVNLTLMAGSRLGLLGVNGAGKSTLIKLLSGEAAPLSGHRIEGKGLKIGYFAQHQLEQLRPDESPLQHMQRLDPQAKESELRAYLGGFDFRGDMALSPVAPFSGGEKSRLALALIIWQRPNLLLLDEPTNHLDLEMRQALTLAMQDFEGTLILVSHDRHLLRATTDSFLLIENGQVSVFDGDLDDYRDYRQQQAADATGPSTSGQAGDRRAQKRAEAEERNRLSALRKPIEAKLKKLDAEMEKLQATKAVIDEKLASGTLYEADQKEGLKAALLQQAELISKLEQLEEAWLELQTELEQIG
ncbi:ATP-binding cassette domain-containing protein [Chitinivorax sp. B]|uniref:ATP-binding cassette domain-containing protein n=1 Tax=Chitinivorax sp. B TaxID=2502235 RepID=UPI0010F79C8D|nr:ATP-binding cassette domain-containing protein [Chitinivorax sp. B]